MRPSEEQHNIVIVGGGICGLATALALHRKGISSLVLEKSGKLRAGGAAIFIYINGWRALDYLGVGDTLRAMASPATAIRNVWLHNGAAKVTPCRKQELRCLKRSDLISTLADNLPEESIRLGCHIVAVEKDHLTSFPILYIDDGSIIKAKVLIGCDGSKSVIAKSLRLKDPKQLPNCVVRGVTSYPNGHNFCNDFLQLRDDHIIIGRIPIGDKQVHWFVDRLHPPKDFEFPKDPKLIRNLALEQLKAYPAEFTEMVEQCDLGSLNMVHLRYRSPWDLLSGSLWQGTTTVAGDAMHAVGPFLGQGGSSALEDAVVLARCLAQAMVVHGEGEVGDQELQRRVGAALGKYVKERKLRVLRLSIQSYLVGTLFAASSKAMRLVILALLVGLFGGFSLSHTQYDCGQL